MWFFCCCVYCFSFLCCRVPIFVQDFRPLPPGVNSIALHNNHHYHHHHHQLQQCLGEGSSTLRFAYIASFVSVLLSSAQRIEAFWSSLPEPPFKHFCTKVALVVQTESSVHMSSRHRSVLTGVRSGTTRRHVTFSICVIESPYYAGVKFYANVGLFSNNAVFALRVLVVSTSNTLIIIIFVSLRETPCSAAAIRRQTAYFYSAGVRGCRLCLVKLTQGLWDVNSSAAWVSLSRIQPWRKQNAHQHCVIQVFYWETWAKKCVPLHAFTKPTLLLD